MKYCHPEIAHVFDTESGCLNTIIIENPNLFLRLVSDVQSQICGGDGQGVLSEGEKPVQMDKKAELLDRFVPFSMESRMLLSKISSALEERSLDGEMFVATTDLLGQVETHLYNIASELCGDIDFDKITMASLIKASGMHLCEEYESLAEKVIDYMELVNEYLGSKLFFTINLRSYISDIETELFMKTVLQHGYHCIMIENSERTRCQVENRYIVDADLCGIE